MGRERIVVALGGNALLESGQPPTVAQQEANVGKAVAAIAPLAGRHDLVVTHGNGPQIGVLESQHGDTRYPLDVVGAETEGMIGYLLERQLRSALPKRRVATLLTHVEVNGDDPAFSEPSKPVGRPVTAEEARPLAAERGWSFKAVDEGCRRIVPSPQPRSILQVGIVRLLLEAGAIAICAGGGGIPVTRTSAGRLEGVEAVIDKDRVSALLARSLDADRLILLTDVDGIYENWRQENERRLDQVTPVELDGMNFDSGSMGPKAEAAAEFARATGRPASIGRLEDAARIAAGMRGTHVTVASRREPPR